MPTVASILRNIEDIRVPHAVSNVLIAEAKSISKASTFLHEELQAIKATGKAVTKEDLADALRKMPDADRAAFRSAYTKYKTAMLDTLVPGAKVPTAEIDNNFFNGVLKGVGDSVQEKALLRAAVLKNDAALPKGVSAADYAAHKSPTAPTIELSARDQATREAVQTAEQAKASQQIGHGESRGVRSEAVTEGRKTAAEQAKAAEQASRAKKEAKETAQKAKAESYDSVMSTVSDLKTAGYKNTLNKEEFAALEKGLKENGLLIAGSRRAFKEGAGSDVKPERALELLSQGKPISSNEFSKIKALSPNAGVTAKETADAAMHGGGRDFFGLNTLLTTATRIPSVTSNFFGKPAGWSGYASSSFIGRALGTTVLAGGILVQPFVDVIPGDFDESIDRGPAQIELIGKYAYAMSSNDYRKNLMSDLEARKDALGGVDVVLYRKMKEMETAKVEALGKLNTQTKDQQNTSLEQRANEALIATVNGGRTAEEPKPQAAAITTISPEAMAKNFNLLSDPNFGGIEASKVSKLRQMWDTSAGDDSTMSTDELKKFKASLDQDTKIGLNSEEKGVVWGILAPNGPR